MNAKEMKNKFLMIADSYISRDGIDELIKWLETETDFFEAPASTKYHSAFDGGLVHHSITVFEELVKEAEKEFGHIDHLMETIAIIGLFHDLCKINTYVKDWKNAKIYKDNGSKSDERGRFDWESIPIYTFEEEMPLGHSQKSVILLQRFIKLTDDEILAIMGHMGGFDVTARAGDYLVSNIFAKCPLAVITYIADMKATYFREVGSSKYGTETATAA